ncbi:transcriptional coactivator p15/PC4 family protein [Ralstonia solanacearum]|uniref:Transcriptional coactivator p15/PC4 family protein n=1 Tax=Ralstonia solanacearum TaxID=305 RepID=A0A7X0Q3K9_RALSL|nr:transcriptional coactivator p15/PC4 family protein [Ralstonia solanacearum]MBB6581896.1 hypothetical protein [Ralstonia solanacearum]MBB6584735.1 hypothetical protein [Ralstonia solanacearum]MDB0524528.1 transcriptional coactivator p15/PC4 family protein [Ralstonia solanacearum]
MTTVAPVATSFLDLQKNNRERLRIEVKEYKGLTYVDLRVWFVGENGEYAPSSKGVMLKPRHVVEVAQGLLLASQAADVKGMG